MRAREFDKAIETLKSYENKGPHLMAHAATNLSFIYFHEGDYAQAPPPHLARPRVISSDHLARPRRR